jgi:hypothetical protein
MGTDFEAKARGPFVAGTVPDGRVGPARGAGVSDAGGAIAGDGGTIFAKELESAQSGARPAFGPTGFAQPASTKAATQQMSLTGFDTASLCERQGVKQAVLKPH